MPLHMYFHRDGSVTLPTVDSEIQVAGFDDGQVGVGGGEDGRFFQLKLGEQCSARSGWHQQMRFLMGQNTFTRDGNSLDVDAVARVELETGVAP